MSLDDTRGVEEYQRELAQKFIDESRARRDSQEQGFKITYRVASLEDVLKSRENNNDNRRFAIHEYNHWKKGVVDFVIQREGNCEGIEPIDVRYLEDAGVKLFVEGDFKPIEVTIRRHS